MSDHKKDDPFAKIGTKGTPGGDKKMVEALPGKGGVPALPAPNTSLAVRLGNTTPSTAAQMLAKLGGDPHTLARPAAATRPTGDLSRYQKAGAELRVAAQASANGRRFFALDETGSMGPYIEAARSNIDTIIQVGEGAPFQLGGYRDYDAPARYRFETSPVTTDSKVLQRWLGEQQINWGGANDGEAIELALEYGLAQPDIAVILLAGDEPPNTAQHMRKFQKTGPTALELAEQKGKERKVKIFPFVVTGHCAEAQTRSDFQRIAEVSGGVCADLDGSEQMVHVAKMALLTIGKSMKDAKTAVERYAIAHQKQLSANTQAFARALLAAHE